MPIIKKNGRQSSDAEVNIQKSLSIASFPQLSLCNRNEKLVYENENEMLRQPQPKY